MDNNKISAPTLPSHILQTITMLSVEERHLLYTLTKNHYTGRGEIIDGGCFVGGSTVALAHGLRDRPGGTENRKIHVFDRFITDAHMVARYFKPAGLDYRPGDSFRPVFNSFTSPISDMLKVNEGDICEIGWSGEPIEIMFIDISKTWAVNDKLLKDFFPHLVTGAVIVQQDYVFEWQPWLMITMEYLQDYFQYIGFVEGNSAVFALQKPIPRSAVELDLKDMPLEQQLRLLDQAIERFEPAELRGLLECAKAMHLFDTGNPSEAGGVLEKVRRNNNSERILKAAKGVEARYVQA